MTPTELKARVHADYPDEEWHNECAGFAYYVCRVTGTVRRAYPSATAARLASTIVSRDVAAAPPGAIHFWEYWATIGGVRADWGHVAVSLGGGLAAMSDPEDWEATWGNDLGVTDVVAWTTRRRGVVTYLGWARSYGENTANITTDQTSGDGSRPFNPTKPILEEDNTMLMLILKGGAKDHLVALSDGIFRHFLPSDPYQAIMQVSRSADDWQEIGLSALPALLRTYGCDLNIWDFRDGRDLSKSVRGTDPNAVFVVLDPLDGSVRPGNVWSAVNAGRSSVAQVKVMSEETAEYLKKLAAA